METNDTCAKCRVTLLQAVDIFSNDITAIDFLQCHDAIPATVLCNTCNQPALLTENLIWRCQRQKKEKCGKKYIYSICNFYQSWRTKTWFSNTKIPLTKCCEFIVQYLLLPPPHQVFLENEFNFSGQTVVDWSHFIRETLLYWSEKNSSSMLGGENVIVEIDEAKFGKRKYNRGRIVSGTWLFGAIERSSKKFFVESVPNRDANTLQEIIQRRIKKGSTVMSDCWKSYRNLSNLGKYLNI